MPAFATRSGLPNSTVNLASGASAAMPWANGGAVLSELGSVQLELARPPDLVKSGFGYALYGQGRVGRHALGQQQRGALGAGQRAAGAGAP